MIRTINIAAAQMIAAPAPTAERLERAENLVEEAAAAGAQLVVLPELFNMGYAYTDENYQRAEPLTGETAGWMAYAAAQHNVHLAGTLLLCDGGEIYNSLLLFAPDGRMWRYDKNYPWQWERAYFRHGWDITVADTDLGKLGLMICWDSCHPELWQRYAGKVDLMVIVSCPPAVHELDMIFPDGKRVNVLEMGKFFEYVHEMAKDSFGEMLRWQAQNLGVPVVHTTGTGTFRTRIPRPRIWALVYTLQRPDLWRYLSQADEIEVESGYFNETYLANEYGQVLTRVPPEVEGYTLGEITLPQFSRPSTVEQQRSWLIFASDTLSNLLLAPIYRQKVQGEDRGLSLIHKAGLVLLATWGVARIFKLFFHKKRLQKRYDRV